MKKIRELFAVILALCIFTGITCGAGWLLLPPLKNCGINWDQFLREERDSLDVLYFGSSITYCDMIPAVVWEESGLTSYVMGGPEQTPAVTYRYLRQACKTQSPQAVVVELHGLFFEPYPDGIKLDLLYMPWGLDRIQAAIQGAAPADRLESLFPLYGVHDRVYSVTPETLSVRLSRQTDPYAGYALLTEAQPLSAPLDYPDKLNADHYRKRIGYLRKISDFCARKEIKLVFCLAPVYGNFPQDRLDDLRRDLASIPHALFLDCGDSTWPDFDPQTQWFDFLHLNLYGAEPFSRRLARELKGLGLETAHSGFGELWQERYDLVRKELAGEEDG